MSVIAKLDVRGYRPFGTGSLIELGCVCQNDLMAMYADSDEDKLFTKASPWGEARLHVSSGFEFPQAMLGDQFYAMLVHKDEPGFTVQPEGAFLVCPARIASVENMGGTTNRVNITSGYDVPKELALRNFNWSMSIDNPGASDQLKPGTDGWLFSIFPARQFDKSSAIASAHGR